MTPAELRAHLLRDHGRIGEDVDRLPAEDLHRLEHVEQELGLVVLDHVHGPAAGVPAPRTPAVSHRAEPGGTPTGAARAPVH